MPKFLEKKLKAEYGENSAIPYKIMNAKGYMRGNKETAKGAAIERKHEKDIGKGKSVRHTIKGNRGAEKPKPGSGMAYSKGSSIFSVPKDIANKDGYSPAGHENRGKHKSLKNKGGHPGEGHKGHAPGNAGAFRDGHGGTLDVQKHTHDGFGEGGHTKRHHFTKMAHRNHASKMKNG